MKIEVYFPHDVCMRNHPGVFELIEAENSSGYGVFWAILEYLRTQEGYVGDIRAINGIARHVKARLDKATRVLNNYGLFVIEGNSFYSPFLNEAMKPLEQKRLSKKVRKDEDGVYQNEYSVFQSSSNALKINDTFYKENKSKIKKKNNIKEIEVAQQFRIDEYRYEDRNPETGQRSYCGVPIPDDAPPRPNNQAVWLPDKKVWFY